MFRVNQKVIDRKTKEIYTIIRKSKNIDFYIVLNKDNEEDGKFEWELEKCSFLKCILGGI